MGAVVRVMPVWARYLIANGLDQDCQRRNTSAEIGTRYSAPFQPRREGYLDLK